MRKLLKLVAIGALLAGGPIQAFADNQTYSDEIQIFNNGVPIVDFKFYDTGPDTPGSNEHLDPLIGTPAFPAWNGNTQALIFTIDNVTNRTDTSVANYVLSLTEGGGTDVSDTLWANFKSTDSSCTSGCIYSVDIYLFDGFSQVGGSSITSVPEDTFDGNATSFLGLTGTSYTVLFASDPGVLNAIPEPEIYAMMGIGLALMGFMARRRRQVDAAA